VAIRGEGTVGATGEGIAVATGEAAVMESLRSRHSHQDSDGVLDDNANTEAAGITAPGILPAPKTQKGSQCCPFSAGF